MTPQTLTTEEDYQAAPLGTVGIDEDGWTWQKIETRNRVGNGTESLWETTNQHPALSPRHETDQGMAKRAIKVIYTPTQADPTSPEPTEEPQREYTTEADFEELNDMPIGTIAKDNEGDLWVKARNGWVLEEDGNTSLYAACAPYTVVHNPRRDPANL